MTAVTSSLRNLLSPFCKDKFLEQSLIQDPSSRPGPDDGALLWPRWSQGRGKATASRFIFPLSDKGWRSGKKEVLRLLDVGIVDIPIPSLPEPPASGSGSHPSTSSAPLPFSGSTPQVQPAHAAESLVESPESLTSVRRRRFLSPGLSRGTRKFLRRQYTLRTINQYAGARSRFSSFVKKKRIPRAEINESTVLNYLSSRLQDPERRRKGKLAPLSLRSVGISHILEGV